MEWSRRFRTRGARRSKPVLRRCSGATPSLQDHVRAGDAAQFRLIAGSKLTPRWGLSPPAGPGAADCGSPASGAGGRVPASSPPHLLCVGLPGLLHRGGEDLLARGARQLIRPLTLRAVALGEHGLDAELGADRGRPGEQAARPPAVPGTPRRARGRSGGRPGRSGSPATCSPRSSSAAGSAKGTPSSTSRVACAMQATINAARASDSCAVACASQMRTSTVPKLKCGLTDHQTCVNSTIERVRRRNSMYSRYALQPPNASGTPQRGKLLVKLCVRAECSPVSRPSRRASWRRWRAAAAVPGAAGRRRESRDLCR